jgi:putative addiction module CopG family antidote
MNVELPPELEKYIELLVQDGQYSASSEVIAEALRQHQVSRPGFQVIMTPQLKKVLDDGMEDLEEVSTTDELRHLP